MPSPWEYAGKAWLNASGFKSREVMTPVGRLHYFEAGERASDKPTLVALHGLSSGAMPLGPVLSRLRHHFGRIIAPDMPGHGFSDAPGSLSVHVIYEGISALLAQILDGPALFFGHSLGGAVSLRVALERPEWVDGLALLSPAGAPTPADQHERWLERFMMADQEAAREFVRSLYVKTPSALPVVAWTCRRLFRRPPVQDILRSTRRDYALTAEQLGSLEVPIRFIWGASERTLLDAHRDFFLSHLPPHAEVLTPEHFTHCPYLEHPDQVAALIAGFQTYTLIREHHAA